MRWSRKAIVSDNAEVKMEGVTGLLLSFNSYLVFDVGTFSPAHMTLGFLQTKLLAGWRGFKSSGPSAPLVWDWKTVCIDRNHSGVRE